MECFALEPDRSLEEITPHLNLKEKLKTEPKASLSCDLKDKPFAYDRAQTHTELPHIAQLVKPPRTSFSHSVFINE